MYIAVESFIMYLFLFHEVEASTNLKRRSVTINYVLTKKITMSIWVPALS
jgi:hypothetical protein